jgi:hypothetical protein
LERFGGHFAVSFLEKNLDSGFRFFELFVALALKSNALLKELHSFIKGKLRAFQFANDFFEARQRTLKIGLLWGLGFSRCRLIHADPFVRTLQAVHPDSKTRGGEKEKFRIRA